MFNNEPFVLTPPPVRPVTGKSMLAFSKRKLRASNPTGRSRWHYHVLVCPRCGMSTPTTKRVRHSYKAIRNWLVKDFDLKRFFSKRLLAQYLLFKQQEGNKHKDDSA